MSLKKNHTRDFFNQVALISNLIDKRKIDLLVKNILNIKKKSARIFFLGVGGSAGNASHAVNDFRKLCNIECYTPTDNVSELTAIINDEGWEYSFVNWLKVSKIKKNDAIFIFSVGGGNKEKKISTNLIKAIDFAKQKKTKVLGVVGREDGYTFKKGDVVISIPQIDKRLITPHTEAFQATIWHCLVSDPRLQSKKTKW